MYLVSRVGVVRDVDKLVDSRGVNLLVFAVHIFYCNPLGPKTASIACLSRRNKRAGRFQTDFAGSVRSNQHACDPNKLELSTLNWKLGQEAIDVIYSEVESLSLQFVLLCYLPQH